MPWTLPIDRRVDIALSAVSAAHPSSSALAKIESSLSQRLVVVPLRDALLGAGQAASVSLWCAAASVKSHSSFIPFWKQRYVELTDESVNFREREGGALLQAVALCHASVRESTVAEWRHEHILEIQTDCWLKGDTLLAERRSFVVSLPTVEQRQVWLRALSANVRQSTLDFQQLLELTKSQ